MYGLPAFPLLVASTTLWAACSWGQCVAVAEAGRHIGEKGCVSGRVVRVAKRAGGVTFLDFCTDFRTCPFVVMVYPMDRRRLGDLDRLAGKTVSIEGRVKQYDGKAEIVLRRPAQLGRDAHSAPAMPRGYDVEHNSHRSAGTFSHSKAAKTAKK